MEWFTIDGNRAIFKWRTVLPNIDNRPGGYEFAGITILEYAGRGKFSLQEDIYNMKECEKVMVEWFGAGGTLRIRRKRSGTSNSALEIGVS